MSEPKDLKDSKNLKSPEMPASDPARIPPPVPAPLDEAAIRARLTRPCDLQVLEVTGSTNDVAKTASLTGRPFVCLANHQTAGRGRKGRAFESPAGTGFYISFAISVPEASLPQVTTVTMAAAVAVARAVEQVLGLRPGIKWVNDLFLDGKKSCGILTEADPAPGGLVRLVPGIGVNCFPGSFPPELSAVAGSLADRVDAFDRSELAAALINEMLAVLEDPGDKGFLADYRKRCFILGRDISVHPTPANSPLDESGRRAHALAVTDDGGLLVRWPDGREEALHSGEVSIRL